MSVSSNRMRLFTLSVLLFAACATSGGDSKIDPLLRAAIDDPAHASKRLAIENGVADVFVQSDDPGATMNAIVQAGGISYTRVGKNVTARLPLDKIRSIAARPEVVRIEASTRDELRP